ncbi:MAG TPA: hypothetical protein VGN07_15880 [Steroidobacteraceae bacterium]|jgi:hypothetical protein
MIAPGPTSSPSIGFAKWTGLYCGVGAWFADQQITSMWVYARCPIRSAVLVLATGLICASIAVGGAWISRRARASLAGADNANRTDAFIATLSVLMGGVGLFAILLGTAAGLILRCER